MSIAEVDDNDRWQSAVLAVALVSNDKRLAAFLPDHAALRASKRHEAISARPLRLGLPIRFSPRWWISSRARGIWWLTTISWAFADMFSLRNLPCSVLCGSLPWDLDKTGFLREFDMFNLMRLEEAGNFPLAWELLMMAGDGLHVNRMI